MLSSITSVTAGVIQGSSLCSALITIYVDSLFTTQINILVGAYTDDFKMAATLIEHIDQVKQSNFDAVNYLTVQVHMPQSINKYLLF